MLKFLLPFLLLPVLVKAQDTSLLPKSSGIDTAKHLGIWPNDSIVLQQANAGGYSFGQYVDPPIVRKYDTVHIHGMNIIVDTAMKDYYGENVIGVLVFWQQKQIDSLIRALNQPSPSTLAGHVAFLLRDNLETHRRLDSLIGEMKRRKQ